MKKTLYEKENLALLALLKSERERMGYSQVELSDALGKPQSFVSKIERGERRLDVIELRSICSALGIELRTFINLLEQKLRQ